MPTSAAFSVSGIITDGDGRPVRDAEVTAIASRARRRQRRVGVATTGDDGRYRIDVPAVEEDEWLEVWIEVSLAERSFGRSDSFDPQPELTEIDLQVHLDGEQHEETDEEHAAREKREQEEREHNAEKNFRVAGTVRDQYGDLLPSVTIEVYDCDLRNKELLGQTTTSQDAAHYEVSYGQFQFARAEKASADLIIRVLGPTGETLGESPLVPNAPPAATIDVDLSGAIWVGESQWERITATLTPLLGEVAPAELREDGEENDITFLAAETGLAPLEIGTWSASFRMARRTGQENAELSPEAVYAFIAQGEPTVYRDNALADLAHPERIELIEDGVLDGLAAIEPQRHRELLTAAVEQNIVPARLTTEFEKILASLATLRVARIGRQNIGGGKGTVTDILGAAELTDADSQVVLETLATHSGPLRDLWTNLQTEKNMSTEAVRRVKLTFELGSLTRNHVPLVTALSQQITRGDIGAKRDLAKFSPEQWAEFLTEKQPDGSAIGVPVNMDGDTEGEKVAMYSAILADQFERAYPTTAFAAKVGRTEAAMPAAAMAAKFVEANPAFFLDRMRVDHYLAQNKTALQGIDDPDATVAAVKTVQRVFKLNPTATAVDALLTREITSAQQVYFMGQSQFTAAIAESGVTSLDARRMYRKAEATYATVLNLFADLNVPLNGPSPAAVAPFTIDEETQAKIASLPNLQTLFGSLDYCECSQCRSVYGEAAYFVDILRFLGDRGTQGVGINAGKNVRQVLLERRPDLGEIELSCQNSNTPLPYIDLVNEILERAVAPSASVTLNTAIQPDLVEGTARANVLAALSASGIVMTDTARVYAPDSLGRWAIRDDTQSFTITLTGGGLVVAPTWQTVGTADEVAASAEHVDPNAYTTVAEAVYPMSLPFDLATTNAHTYLGALSVDFSDLLQLFQQSTAAGLEPSDADLVVARLGMTPVEAQTITGTLAGKQPWDFWGLAETGNDVPHPDTPTDPTTHATGTWTSVLSKAPFMLHRAGLTYRELLQVLDLRFVNPTGTMRVVDSGDSNAANCDSSLFTLAGLDADGLSRITRFVRLWRRLGLTMSELDAAIPNLNPDPSIVDKQLTDSALATLADYQRLTAQTTLPLGVVATLFTGFDNHVYVDRSREGSPVIPTLYQSLFTNRLVAAAGAFPTDITQLSGTVGDKVPGIRGALRLSEADLALVVGELGFTDATALTSAELHKIYRVVVLARAAGLRIADYVRVRALWGRDAFASPDDMLAFLDLAGRISHSAFTPAELRYLLAHEPAPGPPVALSSAAIVQFLQNVRQSFAQFELTTARKPDTTRADYVAAHLGQLPSLATDAEQVEALALVSGMWAGLEADREPLINTYFMGVVDVPTAVAELTEIPPGLSPADHQLAVDARFEYFAPELEAYLLNTGKNALATELTAAFVGFDQPTASVLLGSLNVGGGSGGLLPRINDKRLLQRNPDGTFALTLDTTNFPAAFDALTLLHKVALLVTRFGMSAEMIRWWLAGTHATDLGWISAQSLPLTTGAPRPTSEWVAMESAFRFVDSLPQPTASLDAVAFFDELLDPAGTSAATLDALTTATGWPRAELETLVATFGWLGGSPAVDTVKADLAASANLERVASAISMLNTLGVTAARAISWATLTPSLSKADEMKQALKAKYELPQWLEVIRPVHDDLREKRRDALLAWLLAHPDGARGQTWSEANGIYSYYLIDVEMDACMLTTRIKQASASAQLFIQRVLLGIELDIVANTITDKKWTQWKWMKQYRLWEANRKVFLYPENWIEPQLRDEKSPFFIELEQELQQKDVTADTVEDAYRNYLSKLDQVANLEIRSTFLETLSSTESRLHVFGRTRAASAPKYFHRTQVNRARWTPWEEVDLDIHANHLMVGQHNRRLALLWPQFTEKAEHASQQKTPLENAVAEIVEPLRYWEVRLYWSELRDGVWTPKVLSETPFKIYEAQTGGDFPGRIEFRTRMVPQVRTRLFRSADLANIAPYGVEAFDKLGPQVSPVDTGVTEQLISPPGSYFDNNLIRHSGAVQYFYFASVEESGKGHQLNAHEGALSIPLLNNVRPQETFSVVDSAATAFIGNGSFFTWDRDHTYLVDYIHQSGSTYSSGAWHPWSTSQFSYFIHYHPYVPLFTRELSIGGLPGLLNRRIQVDPTSIPAAPAAFDFNAYVPRPIVTQPLPAENVDFSYTGAYSAYNWELFFHIPMYLGDRLVANQRPEEALQCYNYVFDPTNTDNTTADPNTPQQKFWITKPFYETTKADYYKQKIESIMLAIAKGDAQLRAQVDEWRNNPFNPHLIARMRTVAYQKNVLIKYIQAITAWADQLFARDQMETVAEATQLYVMAAELLGPRPKSIPRAVPNPVKTFYQLQAEGIDDFANVLTEVEGLVQAGTASAAPGDDAPELPRLDVLYFGIPQNDKLLTLWDTVDDRLYKVRHCMNISGAVRQLPLVDPVLDVGALVKAVAGGADLSSALAGLNAPLPQYRFTTVFRSATEVCEQVKTLGAALLAALEKRDAEGVAQLRSTHERTMLELGKQVKADQVTEAAFTRQSLDSTRALIEHRRQYYARLVEDGLSDWEIASLALTGGAIVAEVVATVLGLVSAGTSLIPTFTAGAAGFGGSPYVVVSYGGQNVSGGLSKAADVSRSVASILQMGAGMTNTIAGHERRKDEWEFNRDLAAKELPQVDAQMLAADVRRRIAERELANHGAQQANAASEDEYLHTKYTNDELYEWMISQLSTAYFQSYQLAHELAKRAERSFRYELGLADSNYIQFGHWDALRKGLLAGERLGGDLRQLEAAYYQENKRELELTKHVSLAQLDPVALVQLRQNGECFIDVPEAYFDLDYPGHYFRRLKSVSLSLPCTVGPYATVACTLTLMGDHVRTEPTLLAGKYERDTAAADPRFRDSLTAQQSIATSSGVSDSGMFELSFRDERYLPFEGGGAISTWHIQLAQDPPQFDRASISDVIIHLNYTARDGGAHLRSKASENTKTLVNSLALAGNRQGMYRVIDLAREMPDEYYRLLHAPSAGEEQVLNLGALRERLPWFTRSFGGVKARKIEIAVKSRSVAAFDVALSPLGEADGDLLNVGADPTYKGLLRSTKDLTGAEIPLDGWTLKIRKNGATDFASLKPADVDALYLIINYVVE